MMFRFLPLAIAISVAGAAPVSALTVVKVDARAVSASHATPASATPALDKPGLFPTAMPDEANWAFLFGGVALIAALRLGRRQPLVSN